MRKLGLLYGAAFVALLSELGCGGQAHTGATDAGGGSAGPLATCGSTCTAAQITASCTVTCGKIARAACSSGTGNDCPMSCPALASMAPSCMSAATDFLRCIEPVDPTCPEGGIAQYAGCDSQQQALTDCINGGSSSGQTSSGSGSGVPSSVCPNIPRPGAGGAGTCSGGGGAGPNGPQTCTTSCQDSTGNTWQANCSGSTCTCTYNGAMSCTCTMTGPAGGCSSCCPGTG